MVDTRGHLLQLWARSNVSLLVSILDLPCFMALKPYLSPLFWMSLNLRGYHMSCFKVYGKVKNLLKKIEATLLPVRLFCKMKYVFINDIFYVISFFPHLFHPCLCNIACVILLGPYISILEERLNHFHFTFDACNFFMDALKQFCFCD